MAIKIARRKFIAALCGAAMPWSLGAHAQQGGMRRVGVLMNTAEDSSESQARLTLFVQGLREAGGMEGDNLHIDTGGGGGEPAPFQKWAAGLVALAPDVILASTTPAVTPLLQASRTVPI